ncbi:hypothetical protein FNV43_RR13516 [Rhamnella rubrinervis]|uniref:Wound-responsive family protein n=1 Tax=Rhamnella rubrinervis TaxID=2594499 RepID=A0A8K0MFA8_9ROSA|nr:hypothetical protein FNV43_RR13516 [Rhamnella rubrinervis]
MSGATSRAWFVAASVGVVEALKDQGICRWNHTIRSVHQRAKNHVRSYNSQLQSKKLSPSSSSSVVASKKMVGENQKAKKSEESLRTVMYLSCWGPN